jgi:gamma-glutamyltranspeptidase / glutathione hydrolase
MKGIIIAVIVFATTSAGAATTVVAESAAVSTSEKLATSVGLSVLRDGGSAADAAVAIAFALSVLRPDAAGVGGGGALLYFDAQTGEVWALDFRMRAPNPAYVEGATRREGPTFGVPGFVAGLEELHEKFGVQPWKTLLAPAIAMARYGVDLPEIVVSRFGEELEDGPALPSAVDRGRFVSESHATMLSRIAEKGSAESAGGATAKAAIETSRGGEGLLSARAFAEYSPAWRSPLRIDHGDVRLYTLAPPAGSGVVLAEMVGILSGFNWNGRDPLDPITIHLFAEASRRAWFDQLTGWAESGAAASGVIGVGERIARGRDAIDFERTTPTSVLGNVPPAAAEAYALSFTLTDEEGSVATVSLSLGPRFGSGVLVDAGDFYLGAVDQSTAAANQAAAVLLPLIVLEENRFRLSVAASGGRNVVGMVGSLYLLRNVFGLTLGDAVELPRFHQKLVPDALVCEKDRVTLDLVEKLNAFGHGIEWSEDMGAIQAIERSGTIRAVSDSRGGVSGGY